MGFTGLDEWLNVPIVQTKADPIIPNMDLAHCWEPFGKDLHDWLLAKCYPSRADESNSHAASAMFLGLHLSLYSTAGKQVNLIPVLWYSAANIKSLVEFSTAMNLAHLQRKSNGQLKYKNG